MSKRWAVLHYDIKRAVVVFINYNIKLLKSYDVDSGFSNI